MADSDGDHVGGTTTSSFSQLLFSDDDNDVVGLDIGHAFHYSSSSSSTSKPPKMLCFGGYYKNQYQNQESDNNNNSNKNNVVLISEPTKTTHPKSVVTCSDSSSASSVVTTTTTTTNNNNVNVNANANNGSKSNSKRNGSGQEPAQCTANVAKTPLTSQRISKKAKMENPISTAHPKVRREKLGERITALQQLVSPFGKTDTASVLHEAMGYIRFLQDQVQVLCSPYLQHQPEGEENEEETIKNLKSRGLCLVPVEFTVHVASSNGADYWSPAMGNNFSSSSSTKQ